MSTRTLLIFCTTLCGVSFAFFILSVLLLIGSTGLVRIAPAADLASSSAYHSEVIHAGDREQFRREIGPLPDGEEERVLAILKWVMNQIPKVENRYAKSSWQMVIDGRAGKGLLCSGMAQIFFDALLAHGIPARKVILQRNLFDSFDAHTTVEAWVNGKWRLYDPTFHMTIRSAGRRIGVFEGRDWFLKGKGDPVTFEFLGEVQYPARTQSYPVRYEALLNNVYIDLREKYFPRQVYAYLQDDDGLSSQGQDFYRTLYLVTFIVLPAINAILLLAIWGLWLSGSRRVR
jgi:hypothetical protein